MFENVMKVLVVKLRHIGDVLLTVPLLRAVRESFPDAQVDALINSGTEDMLLGNTLLNEVIVFPRRIKKAPFVEKILQEGAFLTKIRARRYDLVIDLTSGDRGAVLSCVSGARYRIAYDPRGHGFPGKKYLYSHCVDGPDSGKHMVLQNLGLVQHFGITTQDLSVDIAIPDDAKNFVADVLRQHQVGPDDFLVHVHPTARWRSKYWKDEYMAEVLQWMLDRNMTVTVTSSNSEREMNRVRSILSFVRTSSRLIDLSGATTLKQLAALSQRANLFFGVDTAPMHIAAAAGTPVVALFGPSGEVQWGPWGDGHDVITRKMRCSTCPPGYCDGATVMKCLEAISPGDVIEVLARRMQKSGMTAPGTSSER